MRVSPVLVIACLAAAAAGCGGDDEPRAQRPPRAVELKIGQPRDTTTVRAESVEVNGTVTPANAAVTVVGQRAAVSGGGTFTATIALQPGANVIDVMATAAGRASGTYKVERDGGDPYEGTIVFGVIRERGEPRIQLIAATPKA